MMYPTCPTSGQTRWVDDASFVYAVAAYDNVTLILGRTEPGDGGVGVHIYILTGIFN